MYDQLKRHEIHVLLQAGLSMREVARKAEVSLYTVERVLREERPSELSSSHRMGRPQVASPFDGAVREILRERPDLPTVEVLRRLRERG